MCADTDGADRPDVALRAWVRRVLDEVDLAAEVYELGLNGTFDPTAQPAVAHWNPSGYLWNQYDAVRVEVK